MKDLRLLEFAVALDRHRRFGRAAEEFGVTQPAFSRAIAALESELETRLFDRSTRRVEPTPEGRIVLDRARQLLADAAAFRDAVRDYRELRWGRVAVGTGPYPLQLCVLDAVARLLTRYPSLHVELLEGAWHEFAPRLLSGEMELAVMEMSAVTGDPRFQVESLPPRPGRFFCRAGHPLTGRRGITLTEVLAYPLVGSRLPRRLSSLVHHAQGRLTVDPRSGDLLPQILTTSFAACRAIVGRTDGVGLAVLPQIAADIARGELAVIDLDLDSLRTSYGIITVRDRTLSPAAEALAETIRAAESAVTRRDAAPHAARAPKRRTR